VVEQPKNQVVEKNRDAKRPKKRRKNTENDSAVEMGNHEQSDTGSGKQPQPVTKMSQNPLPTLPSFPLPTPPDAPPISVLALQGLDQALVDAEIVDPTTILPIPPDGDYDAGTSLTERTRRRLKELGITELFAGLHHFYLV
jgi:ATP-dependent RNA helicase DDX51/DBP6